MSALIELYGGETAVALWKSGLDHLFIDGLINKTIEFRSEVDEDINKEKNSKQDKSSNSSDNGKTKTKSSKLSNNSSSTTLFEDLSSKDKQLRRQQAEASLNTLLKDLQNTDIYDSQGVKYNITHLAK